MKRRLALIALLVTAPVLSAQIIPGGGRPVRPNVQRRVPGDTSRTDSARADTARHELIKWELPDSIETELLNRAGFTATRYQGLKVKFDAKNRILYLEGSPATGRAAVGRTGTILVGDTITYNDSTKIIIALGDTLMLRDPSRGSSDVVALGRMTYNVEQRRGTVTNISTSIESGEKWFVEGAVAAFRNDTTGGKSTAFYARNGIITSCDDSVPDYHFAAKEIKMVSRNIMVARPAILYIGDVPVFYLPFIFQDMRSGRRSGILTPRFGVGEIFRNSPSYRRHVDNLGYYFAINDYMDGEMSLDWRSGAASTTGDPGWVRLNGEWRYRWLDRFVTGRLAVSRTAQRDGFRNTAVSWGHQQDFSQTTHLTTDVNFVTSTTLQRQNTFDPRQSLATIRSSANYSQQFGPASMTIGGSRTQYAGRNDVSQDFPNFNISTPTIPIASWLEWTPSLNVTNAQLFKVDRIGEFAYQFVAGVLDTTKRLTADSRISNVTFQTPLKIFGFTLSNSFTANDQENNQPVRIPIINQDNPSETTDRIFARQYSTQIDWNTSFGLPSLMQSTLKLAPSISFSNVDGHAFWVRTEQTGGRYVHQTKRPSYSLSASPTFFGLFPGIGGISRFRHAISSQIIYSYAPAATVGKDYLAALNIDPRGYLGSLASNAVSLGLSQVLEAKMKQKDTSSTAPEPRKIKLLSIGTSSLNYDFERKRKTGHSGFTQDAFGYDLSSDLLPGFTFRTDYSLFQGNPLSDSSKFKPFRTNISSSFSFNGSSGIFGAIARVFGRAIPNTSPQTEKLGQNADDALSQRVASTPVAGSANRNNLYAVPATTGSWQASFQFSSTRQRPPTGNGTIIEQDPKEICRPFLSSPLQYDVCIEQQSINPTSAAPITGITNGTPFVRVPSRENLGTNMSFHLTPKWSGTWGSNYDFQSKRFGSHAVSLQRELHDWRAIFAFTRTPTGNFSFNFFVALNAQPDIKFNYDRQTYRQSDQ